MRLWIRHQKENNTLNCAQTPKKKKTQSHIHYKQTYVQTCTKASAKASIASSVCYIPTYNERQMHSYPGLVQTQKSSQANTRLYEETQRCGGFASANEIQAYSAVGSGPRVERARANRQHSASYADARTHMRKDRTFRR